MPDPNRITVRSSRREELVDITSSIQSAVKRHGIPNGVIYLWSLHTTCGLTVNEGADRDVAGDLVAIMRQLVPQSKAYAHAEGNSDSHAKTSLFGPGLSLLIEDRRLVLGQWQHVFLAEWDGPRERSIAFTILAAG